MKSTIINGDCLEEMKKIPDNSIKLIITDPPYSLPNTNFRPKARLSQKTFGDFSTYVHFFKQFIVECKRVLREDGDLVLFCDEVFYAVLYPILYQEFYASKMIVWDKGKIGMGGIWRRQFEIFVHSYLLPKKEKSGDGDVVKFSPVSSKNKIHFSQKPVDLLKKIILKTTSEGDFVLDPFMGSGSVIVACNELKRESIGIELSEEVYNRAKNRLSPTSHTLASPTFPTEKAINRNLKDLSDDKSQISANAETSLNSDIHQNFPFALQSRVQLNHNKLKW